MNWHTPWQLVKDTFHEWSEDKAPRLGAALAYYSVFSIAPLLIIAIGSAGLVFGEKAARGEIVSQVGDTIGESAAQAIEDMVKHTYESGGGVWATIVGMVIMFIGATGVFVQLQDALNTVWKVAPKPGRGVMGMIRDRFLSFSVVLGIGFLLLVSLVASAALSALGKFLTPGALPGGAYLWEALNFVISLLSITLFFALLFKWLPDVKIAWRDVWIGAAATALLFTVGTLLIGVYLGESGTSSAFGAAGALVILLVWVYYSAQIVLLGAEFTRVYANRFGSHVVPADNAMPVRQDELARQGMPRMNDGTTKAGRARTEKVASQKNAT
jgi:membrane protein